MLKHVSRAIFLLLCCLSVILLKSGAQEATTPAFGTGGVHLLLESNQDLYQQDRFLGPLEISSDNQFVVGEANVADYTDETTIHTTYVWDISETSVGEGEIASIIPVASHTVTVPQIFLSAPPAISPNSDRVVIHTDRAIQVATVPDLQIQATLETIEARIRYSTWSLDSMLIATVLTVQDTNHLVVWDIETNEVYEMAEVVPVFDVLALQDGWLLRSPWHSSDNTAFIVCTRLLETCETYKFSGGNGRGPVLVTLDGSHIFGETEDEDGHFHPVVWERLPNGVYQQRANLPDFDIGGLHALSPDGRYLQAGANVGIWRTDDWKYLGDSPYNILFTPDSQTFVAASFRFGQEHVSLYESNTVTLLDEVLFQDRFGFELRFYGEDMGIADISEDGRWLGVVLATSAVLIPLENR